jgi:hypothetical protein
MQGVERLREQIVEVEAIQSRGRNYEPLPKRVPRVRHGPSYYNPGEINNSQQLGPRTGVGRTQTAPIIIEISGDSNNDATEPQPAQQPRRRRSNRQPRQQESVGYKHRLDEIHLKALFV